MDRGRAPAVIEDGLGPEAAPAQPPAAAGPAAVLLRLYPALGLPTFRLFWLGMLPSTLAWQMAMVATGYAAFVLTDSATMLGVVSLAVGLPMLLFSLVGGVAADRFPRRTVLLLTQSVFAIATGAVALLSLAGRLSVWHLVVLSLIQGTVVSFNMPARQAYIAELVGARLLRNAVALNNAGLNFSRIAGPALAGALLALPAVGIGGVFLVMTVMYGVVIACLWRLPASGAEGRRRSEGGWAELQAGLGYIRRSPVLVALLALAVVPLFFGLPYQTLMPVFAERVFAVGAAGLGVLMTASGLGALGGALAVAALANSSRPAVLQLGCGLAFGLSLVAFALAPVFPVAVALLVVVGFASAAYTALNNTLLLSNATPQFYGRVMSVYMLTFAVMPIATLPAAWLADHVGGRATIGAGGVVVAAVVAGVAALYPPYRHIR
ncbi:MAG TPA: MFS transporter [Chloroflexota bacterium]|nr:MFS transporter [Chloroflexota bacterium]